MAGSTLGSFSYDLLLNYALFQDGLNKAEAIARSSADKISGSLEKGLEKVGDAFKDVAVILGVGFSLEKLVEVGKVALETAEQISSLSQALGVTTQTLQTMQYVAALGGGNLEQVSASLERLERSGEQAASGNMQAAEAFRALGISSNQLSALLEHPDQLMIEIAKSVSTLGDGSAKTAAVMQIFGRNSAQLIPFLNKLGSNFEHLQDQAREFGVVLSGTDQAALTLAQENLNELGQALRGAGNQFTLAMLPAIEAVTDAFKDLFESGTARSFFEGIATDVSQTVAILGQLWDNIKIVGEVLTDIGVKGGSAFQGLPKDLAGAVQSILDDWAHLKATFKEGWIVFQADAAEAWMKIQNVVIIAIKTIATDFTALLGQMSKFAEFTGNLDLSVAFSAMAKNVESFGAALQPATVDFEEYRQKILSVQTAENSEIAANRQWADAIRLTRAGIKDMSVGYDEFVSSLKRGDIAGNDKKLSDALKNINDGAAELIRNGADQEKVMAGVATTTNNLSAATLRADQAQGNYNAKVKDSSSGLNKYQQDLQKVLDLSAQLSSGLGGPYLAALEKHDKGVELLVKTWTDALKVGKANQELLDLLNHTEQQLDAEYARTTKQIKAQHDVMADAQRDTDNLLKSLGVEPKYRQDALDALNKYDDLMKSHYDFYGNYIEDEDQLKQKLQEQLPLYLQLKKANTDLTEAIKLNDEVAKEWVDIWVNAGQSLGDTFAKILVEGGSLFDSLKDMAKNMVEQIISYFAKLAVINPILNAIFGGQNGFSTLASFGGGGNSVAALLAGGGGGGATTVAGLAAASSMAGPNSYGSNGQPNYLGTAGSTYQLFNAGKSMFAGFQSGFDNLLFGAGGDSTSMFGAYTANMYGPGGTFAPSALGYGAAAVGGAYAGYQEYQRAGGGIAGVAGGAAYGVGTAAIGLGVASAATGGGLIAGLSVLGPIGWAAIALMAVDMLSGGKLFGTKGKFNFGEQAINVGAGGATVTTGYDLKGQKPLFGGSTHDWQTVATDPAAQAAADAFYAALIKNSDNFAKQFGVKAGELVGGMFVATFDKKGNITKQESTVLGKTYSEDAASFQQRLVDENDLKILEQFDSKLDASVDQYRKNVEDLTGVVQGLAQGEAMFKNGTSFLALGTDQSLSALLALAQGAQMFGESIGDTLQRIEQAQAQYDQFVAQFKTVTYVDDYEKALSGINATMQANIKQANALAIAAGAAGASEEDLANIHHYAAAQAAQALLDLEASAQALAFSMGLTVVGSLDDVNSEISRLQAKAGNASQGVNNFANAMQNAAQKAKAAIDLLIGDLSPLNDQQKLQVALQGLRAGTVTQEEVLQIGKRLYASSQAYVDLFNMVKGIGDHTQGSVAQHEQAAGLTGAEQTRLTALLKEQTQLQAAQDYQNAQTLTQQIAEIALSKGEDWQQVIAEMGVNQQDLEKRLNLDDDGFAKLIAADQAKQDSAGQNSQDIISAIDAMSDAIVTALGGTPGDHGHSEHAQPGATEDPRVSRGGHSQRNLSDDDANAVGRAVGRALGNVIAINGPRNLRGTR